MANSQNVQLNLATRAVKETDDFYASLVLLQDINILATNAGYVYGSEWDAIFEAIPELAHLDNTNINQFLGFVVPGIIAFLETEITSSKTYLEWISLIRSGGSQ